MKLLKEEEFNNLALKGKGRSSPIFNSLVNLNIGEGVLIEKKDWNRKASPSTLVKYIEKTHSLKFTCGELLNGQGWAVKRVPGVNQAVEKKQESPLIKKAIYDYISEPRNYNKFDMILTFSYDLIKLNPDKFKFYAF